jgi:hypothetical protein
MMTLLDPTRTATQPSAPLTNEWWTTLAQLVHQASRMPLVMMHLVSRRLAT